MLPVSSVPRGKQFVSMISTRNKERRRWQRLPLGIPVFVHGLDKKGKRILEFTTVLNVSAGGVLLAMHTDLPRRSVISLQVPAGNVKSPFQAKRSFRAQVLRVDPKKGWYACAAKFSSPLLD